MARTILNKAKLNTRTRVDRPYSPVDLFTGNEVGLWYDPSDLTPEKLAWVAANPGFTAAQFLAAFPTHTLYQNSTGTTPVTALGQPVGLVIDKSKGGLVAMGVELITNGDFSNGTTGWIVGSGWSVANGSATTTTNVSKTIIQSNSNIVAGKSYRVTYTASGVTVDAIRINVRAPGDNFQTGYINLNGNVNLIFTSTVSGAFGIFCYAAGVTITNISVREVPGVHATQGTDAARPTLQARANLLTYSEQFNNAAWALNSETSITANQATAPDGTFTADKITATSISDPHRGQGVNIGNYVGDMVGSVWLWTDAGQPTTASLFLYKGLDSTGTSFSQAKSVRVILSTTPQRFNITGSFTSDATRLWTIFRVDLAQSGSDVGAVVNEYLYAWGAQLEYGTVPSTYQRVTTATDYADVGLPRSLTFDGTDDSLVTPSASFTSTDKMTVCAGVFKQSDAATAVALELSTTSATNNGTFALFAPNTSNDYGIRSRGTGSVTVVQGGYTAPIINVVTGMSDIAAPSVILRVNGNVVGSDVASSQGTGNYGNYPIYIGRRGGTTLPFNGRIHQLIVRGAATSGSLLELTERYVGRKTGIDL